MLKNKEYQQERKFVAKLYIGVLTQRISIKEALLMFPKCCEDSTIIAAWHALCHLEADEELRQKDKMFAQEQDDYIEYIAYTLAKGEALAKNIIDSYSPYYENALIPTTKNINGVLKQMKKYLCLDSSQ